MVTLCYERLQTFLCFFFNFILASKKQFGMQMGGACGGGCPQQCAPSCQQSCCGTPEGQTITHLTTVHHHHVHHMAPAPPIPPAPPLPPPPPPMTFHTQQHVFECEQPPCQPQMPPSCPQPPCMMQQPCGASPCGK